MKEPLEEMSEKMAAQLAALHERAVERLMQLYNFKSPAELRKAGYHIVNEKAADGEEYYILCTEVARERVPKMVFASNEIHPY